MPAERAAAGSKVDMMKFWAVFEKKRDNWDTR